MNDNDPLPKNDDVVYLDPAEWDRFMHEMLNPRPPSKAIIEGAKLWAKLKAEMGE